MGENGLMFYKEFSMRIDTLFHTDGLIIKEFCPISRFEVKNMSFIPSTASSGDGNHCVRKLFFIFGNKKKSPGFKPVSSLERR